MCLLENETVMERVMKATMAGTPEITKDVNALRDKLLPTLAPEQLQLYNQIDELIIQEGNELSYLKLKAACGCEQCVASDVIAGLQTAINDIDKLEAEVNNLRSKGLFPGVLGDPIPIS